MVAFSYRQFIRQMPKESLQDYFEQYKINASEEIDWTLSSTELNKKLFELMVNLSPDESIFVFSQFQKIKTMADELGINAILSAAEDSTEIIQSFQLCENDLERVMLVFLEYPELFKSAEEIRYFNFKAKSQSADRNKLKPNLFVSSNLQDISDFEQAISAYFTNKNGSGKQCHVDIIQRHHDHSIQLSIYTEALPSNVTEFGDNGLEQRASRTAIEFAIVYRPDTGIIETVVKGGKPVHKKMRELFAKHLLKVEPDFSIVESEQFRLNRLIQDINWQPDPRDLLQMIRLRLLKLRPKNESYGYEFIIKTPSQGLATENAKSTSKRWFPQDNPLYKEFDVFGAIVSFHFYPKSGRTRGRTLHCDINSKNITNLKSFVDEDRAMIEKYFKKWGLIDENN